mmetsp:Transcript_12003/g.15562  ORF Transcript_12003/g.15562 Transcript_12003/m.15562 type:complete len:583 (+) Transcript_12003:163-1911(+)
MVYLSWSLSEDAKLKVLIPNSSILDQVLAVASEKDLASTRTNNSEKQVKTKTKETSRRKLDFDAVEVQPEESESLISETEGSLLSNDTDTRDILKEVNESLQSLLNESRSYCYAGEVLNAYLIVVPTRSGFEKEKQRVQYAKDFPSILPAWKSFFGSLFCHLNFSDSKVKAVSGSHVISLSSGISSMSDKISPGEGEARFLSTMSSFQKLHAAGCAFYRFELKIANCLDGIEFVDLELSCVRPAISTNLKSSTGTHNEDNSRNERYDYRYEIAGGDFSWNDPMMLSSARKELEVKPMEGLYCNQSTLIPRLQLLDDPHSTAQITQRVQLVEVLDINLTSQLAANSCIVQASVQSAEESEAIQIHDASLNLISESDCCASPIGVTSFPVYLQPGERINFAFRVTRVPKSSPIDSQLNISALEIHWCSDSFRKLQCISRTLEWKWTCAGTVPVSVKLAHRLPKNIKVEEVFQVSLELHNRQDDMIDVDIVFPYDSDTLVRRDSENIPVCVPLSLSTYIGNIESDTRKSVLLSFVGLCEGLHLVMDKLYIRNRKSNEMYRLCLKDSFKVCIGGNRRQQTPSANGT